MSLQIYWLVVAPGLLFGLSLIGWLALWLLPRPTPKAKPAEEANKEQASAVQVSGSYTITTMLPPDVAAVQQWPTLAFLWAASARAEHNKREPDLFDLPVTSGH